MNSIQTCVLLVVLMGNFCVGLNETIIRKDHRQSKKNQQIILKSGKNPSYYRENPYGPGTYSFGYYINDMKSGNFQFREEEKFANRTVLGAYGHLRPDGKVSVTHYIADEKGYRSDTETYNQSKYKPGKSTKKPKKPNTKPNTLSTVISTTLKPLFPLNTSTTKKPNDNKVPNNTSTINYEMAQNTFDKHMINLFPNQTNGLDPQTLNIINGKVPMSNNSNGTIAFSTLNDYIPNSFPIVPFQLPTNVVPKS